MKYGLKILALTLFPVLLHAQQETINHLRYELAGSGNDTSKFAISDSLSMYYLFSSTKVDSSSFFIHQSINDAISTADKKFLVLGYARLGFYYLSTSKLKPALDMTLKAISLSKQYQVNDYLSFNDFTLAFIYAYIYPGTDEELKYCLEAKSHLNESKDSYFDMPFMVNLMLSDAYESKDMVDSVYYYLHIADSLSKTSKQRTAIELSKFKMGNYYFIKKEYSIADSLSTESFNICKKNNDVELMNAPLHVLASSLLAQNRINDAIAVARSTFAISASVKNYLDIAGISGFLSNCYEKLGQKDSAYFYLKQSDSITSVYMNSNIITQVNEDKFEEQNRLQEEQQKQALENEKNRSRIIQYVFATGLLFLLIIAVIQWRNNIHRKKTNILLQHQKEKVETTLQELKSTQAQLIQSEKMASLGELTAGIAHEIQNPLNFVNNFSEVNEEMIDELQQELKSGNVEEAISISNEIKENQEKINHHGKRADAIVKGMLQHSRQSSGQKEPTDINKLADEYLRLSYHGLRAKDKSFNATIETDFDNSIGKINIIPQDIGRVLLNLFNNAFYACTERSRSAVNEKKKTEGEKQKETYNPTVSLSTKKSDDHIEIHVKDNGNGISQKILDKIFQPFFTTKPTGQGTGLGLSLSYDIVKAHGGEIKVESKEGGGSEFIIQLPLNK